MDLARHLHSTGAHCARAGHCALPQRRQRVRGGLSLVLSGVCFFPIFQVLAECE